jgi:hypothetical protein
MSENVNLSSKVVKIKKARRCHSCQDQFQPGDKMVYFVGIFEGDFNATYYCQCCDAYMATWNPNDYDSGIGEGDFKGEKDYEDFKLNYKKTHP